MAAAYEAEALRRLHEIEIDILKEIMRVCQENDLTMFIDWGTLLGAMRHGGFIPWDDDIDISMPRKDYERFLEIAPSQLAEGYFLQHFSTEEKSPTYWAKVRRDGTVFVEDYAKDIPIHQGVFVDVMPYDATPEEPAMQEKHRKKIAFWEQVYIAKDVSRTMTRTGMRKLLGMVLRSGLHLLLRPVPKAWLYRKLDRVLRQYEGRGSRYMATICTAKGVRRMDEVFPVKQAKFEDIMVPVPNQPERLLEQAYGDYMQLPPEEQRVGHCPELFDLGNIT